MMYVSEVPWHKLGTALAKPATAAEAIRAAQLDWTVIKAPLQCKVDHRLPPVPDRFAVVRSDSTPESPQPVLGIVGSNYTPLQNRDAFSWFDAIVGEGAAIYHTAGALGDGERVWILAKLPGEIRVVGDDVTDKFLLLSNSHDGSASVQVKFTPIRVVCQNTLTMALRSGPTVRIAHTRDLNRRMISARMKLGIIQKQFGKLEEAFRRMAKVQVTGDRLTKYLELVLPKPADEENTRAIRRVVLARAKTAELFETGRGNTLPQVGGSLWAAYNAVTEFVDHYQPAGSGERRLDSIWFGDGYLTKTRAYRVAMQHSVAWRN
jgi:phage/plasmid-like protein (TIGR03299 family)